MSYNLGYMMGWGAPHPPLPKTRPRRYRFWWFWRFYGYVFYIMLRRAWSYYSHWNLDSQHRWVAKFKSYPAVRKWVYGEGVKRALASMPVRYFIYKLLTWDYGCPHCGDEGYADDDSFVAEDGKTVQLFECTDSGVSGTMDGTIHWWEGWLWCYRCGHYEWHHDST